MCVSRIIRVGDLVPCQMRNPIGTDRQRAGESNVRKIWGNFLDIPLLAVKVGVCQPKICGADMRITSLVDYNRRVIHSLAGDIHCEPACRAGWAKSVFESSFVVAVAHMDVP